jgi:hypothetical protein
VSTRRKNAFRIAIFGFALSLAVLGTGLPMRNVGTLGQAATAAFLVLNPPFVAVQFAAPYEAHELEHSVWPSYEYPTAILVSMAWWLAVYRALRYLSRRRNAN